MIKRFLPTTKVGEAIAETTDGKYIIVSPMIAFVTDIEPEQFNQMLNSHDLDDDFYDSFESYALDDCDCSYYKGSEYSDDITDTIIKSYLSLFNYGKKFLGNRKFN